MTMNSVNNVIVKPEMTDLQFIESDYDQDSNLNDSIYEAINDISKYMNGIQSTDGVSKLCSVCEKMFENEDIGMHSHVSEAINNEIIYYSPSSTAMYIEHLRFS